MSQCVGDGTEPSPTWMVRIIVITMKSKAKRLRAIGFCLWLALSAILLATSDIELKVLDPSGQELGIDSVIAALRDKRVVFIGESHDRYDNHLNELEIIRRLHEIQPRRWAIGVEFIQRKFQPALDAYLAGSIEEKEFLEKTEYFDRWGFDYRLYRPIFQYAKENAIPTIALNAEQELSEKVATLGLEGLAPSDRDRLPQDFDKSDSAYRDRLQAIFQQHSDATKGNFEHFFEAQLTWDETMAETAANYLTANPDKAMIVLAGGEHMAFGSGIPNRVKRRLPDIPSAILLADREPQEGKSAADYYLVSPRSDLPPAGKLGLVMDMQPNGVVVKQVTKNGAAAQAGVKPKDLIVAIAGQPVHSLGDIRLVLLDKQPGKFVDLVVQRKRWTHKSILTFPLNLQE